MPTHTPVPTAIPQPTTLREFADALGIEIGAHIAVDFLQDWHPESAKLKPIFAREFNLHGSPWDSMWANPYTPLRPSRDKYDFSKMDKLVAFARANNMRVQVLHLIWGQKGFLPSWLTEGSHTREELLSIMQEHISTFVGRYKGKVHEWSVVNEFYGGWQTENFWLDKLGTDFDWAEAAFRWAHEADPGALLFYNDFGFEFGATNDYTTTKSNQVYTLVADLVKRGVPIHGIGFQMHLDGKDFASQQQLDQRMILLQQEIQKYKDLGLAVLVTEWDIDIRDISGTQEERYRTQAQMYGAIFRTCIQAGVASFSLFGPLTDRLSWREDPNQGGAPNADALIFDDNYEPKPAYFTLLEVLQKLYAQ